MAWRSEKVQSLQSDDTNAGFKANQHSISAFHRSAKTKQKFCDYLRCCLSCFSISFVNYVLALIWHEISRPSCQSKCIVSKETTCELKEKSRLEALPKCALVLQELEAVH